MTAIAPEVLPLAPVFGPELGRRVFERHRAAGVEFCLGTRVKCAVSTGLITEDGREVECDAVLVGVGSQPETRLLADAGLCSPGRPVEVGEDLRTSDPSVFAAGDIVSVPYLPTGTPGHCEHWTTAMRQGREVARIICDESSGYRDVPFFWSDQYDFTLKSVGIPNPSDERRVHEDEDGSILVGYFEEGELHAAAAIGFDGALQRVEAELRSGARASIDDFDSLASVPAG